MTNEIGLLNAVVMAPVIIFFSIKSVLHEAYRSFKGYNRELALLQ